MQSNFLHNHAFWLPLLCGVLVQVFKFVRHLVSTHRMNFRMLTTAGGMPSSHAAAVTSLATTIAIEQGAGSPLFAMSCVLAGIVMYDAAGVRQAAGKQARILNQIVDELFAGHPISEEKLRELLGHTPTQVIVGALVGVVVTWAWLAVLMKGKG